MNMATTDMTMVNMTAVKILVLAGSLRRGSYNRQLAGAAARELALAGVDITEISLADFPLPIYDADLEAQSGVSALALQLKRQFMIHHGILLVSPEYNASVSPLLKNAIDWISRVRERGEDPLPAFSGRVFALGAASPGKFGGMRGLMALRQVLELGCGASVIPQQVTVAFADRAFDETGHLRDERDAAQLRLTLRGLIDAAQRIL